MKPQAKLPIFLSLILLFSMLQSALSLDHARIETRTDLAHTTFDVDGSGVIVAIIDRGIDWTHQDFRNDDGSTRIKYIFDLMNDSGSGAPGNTYGMGTIYTEAQINAALLKGAPALATRDAVGHGTSTTGLAAGNGRSLPDRRYRGIAPGASIIAVKFTSEGAPAHDGQPAEAAYYQESRMPVAMNFVRDKAAQLQMPVVMLANFGTINGPTDGTSASARSIDAMVGPGKPGIIFVTGTGDDGGMPNRIGGNVANGATTSIRIQKNTAGNLRTDLWYPGADRISFSVTNPAGTTFGPFTAPVSINGATNHGGTGFAAYHRGGTSAFYGAQNGKREIMLDISGANGTYTLNLIGTSITSTGRFDGTLNPSRIPNLNNSFLDFLAAGSIIDQATAFNNIAPNSYVIRNTWIDIDGVPRQVNGQGAPGELWLGSSIGPTFDGRRGVDLSAPGDLVISPYSETSYWATFRFNMAQGGLGKYGRAGAVSAAAPQVTGLIALMLEKNPGLDAPSVRALLQRAARQDSFTGAVPNNSWGYGKMDSYNAVELAMSKIVVAGRALVDGRGVPNAIVTITDALGVRQTARTNNFGAYRFKDLPIGRDYTLTVSTRGYSFKPQTVAADDNVDNLNLIGD